jgi:hypothetical protein
VISASTLELTPLETLSPAAARAAGPNAPAPVKLMAARGMAPLPPADLAAVLYQLHLSPEAPVAQAALKSAGELPDPLLLAALAAPLDPRVLDFFARQVGKRPTLVEVVLLNRATHDETLRHLAMTQGEAVLELIAKNEERLLRAPDVIAALYLNPRTRMSTAQRVVELAARNNVRVEAIPAFDEIARAVSGEPVSTSDDEAFREAATLVLDLDATAPQAEADAEAAPAELSAEEVAKLLADTEAEATPAKQDEEKAKKLTDLSPAAKIRVATLGNAFGRSVLIRDKNRQVSMACIKSPGVSSSEALKYATNRSLDDDIIRYIATQRAWTRLPGIRLALCNNPKTPLPTAIRMLATLPVRDLKIMSRSKGIAAALQKHAKELVSQRGQ